MTYTLHWALVRIDHARAPWILGIVSLRTQPLPYPDLAASQIGSGSAVGLPRRINVRKRNITASRITT